MIYWINEIPREEGSVPPVHRLGFLDGKTETIHRHFDHISFSVFTGDSMDLSIQFDDERQRIQYPCLTLGLPGDRRIVEHRRPADEFFCAYETPYLLRLFTASPSSLPRLRPLASAPTVSRYVGLLRTLVENHPISPSLCRQIDLICQAMILSAFQGIGSESAAPVDKRMVSIENELRSRYRETIDYDDLARRNCMSFSSMRRLWHAHHDTSPHELIMELRNNEAKELLKDPLLSISEVARAVGYDDPQYFSRFFIRFNHCTPTQYRKKNALPADSSSMPRP